MKKNLFLLIALFCVTFLYAQNNENHAPIANEELFKRADLVFEGRFWKVVAAYNIVSPSIFFMVNSDYPDESV